MKRFAIVVFLLALAPPLFAMPNRQRTFRESCDEVWKAAVAVAKGNDYRIVSLSTEEHVISLVAGGVWGGERLVDLSLETGKEGCVASVQSRFSGLAHSDGPDLLARVGAELLARQVGITRDSKEFRRFQNCLESPTSNKKCEERFRKDVAKLKPRSTPPDGSDWWKISPPPAR
jgi:hypothetical protein